MSDLYKTGRWKSKRENILRRDEYRCRECKRYGKTKDATTVHHIHPLDHRPELGLNNNNLISLCKECHGKMHDRVTNELTELGRQWVERMNKNIFNIPPT